jgi:hypothetical protein
MINGNACFAYFNKNWGIPGTCLELGYSHEDDRRGADGIIDGHACDIVVGAAELNGSSA